MCQMFNMREDQTENSQVTMKVDIEKAEYAVLGQLTVRGLLCHPNMLLVEFHHTHGALESHQIWKQKPGIYNEQSREQCFVSGFVSTLEHIVQYCPQEPELVYWP
eukprot:TRINITY_DN3334_c1_g1_i2.p9 TRINITY_DN3334_c1_g1~~TRINITY_DN3334_c1_g1_i2.p9  ORF type:complete len:105 (-),score=5.49 TRINITY_DN3334_c1_g1_i2:303-617(-)